MGFVFNGVTSKTTRGYGKYRYRSYARHSYSKYSYRRGYGYGYGRRGYGYGYGYGYGNPGHPIVPIDMSRVAKEADKQS